MTDIKNDDGLLPETVWLTRESDKPNDIRVWGVEVYNSVQYNRHNPQPTEKVQAALDDIKSLYAKISPNDKPKPTLEDFGAVLYNHEQTIRNALMKGAQ